MFYKVELDFIPVYFPVIIHYHRFGSTTTGLAENMKDA